MCNYEDLSWIKYEILFIRNVPIIIVQNQFYCSNVFQKCWTPLRKGSIKYYGINHRIVFF